MTSASLTTEAYTRLRDEIIRGYIRPNERLIAADLADRLDISRTPVREALQLLAAEGLVETVKRGYAVREPGKDEIREIYEVRAALEGMAVRLMADRGSAEDLAAIVAIGAHDLALGTSARQVLVELNEKFHTAIFVGAKNTRLMSIDQRNSKHFFNYRIAEQYTDDEARASVLGHRRIVEALLARDGDKAEAAARQHIFEGLELTLQKISWRRR